jgi:hypothetical protein
MDKSQVLNIVNNLKSKEIDRFVIRYEGGNRFTDSKSDSSRIYLGSDYVVILDTTTNFTNPNARWNIRKIPYENIDNIAAYDLSTKEAINILNEEGIFDETMQELIKKRGGRVMIKPVALNTSAYGEEKEKVVNEETGEEELVTVIKGDEPGRITTGSSK